jgi:hypothetical protein
VPLQPKTRIGRSLRSRALLEELAAEAARNVRRQRSISLLQDAQDRHFAAIAGEPIGDQVPVMVAIRTTGHGIVTGELFIPADRWDPVLFLRFLQEQDCRPA